MNAFHCINVKNGVWQNHLLTQTFFTVYTKDKKGFTKVLEHFDLVEELKTALPEVKEIFNKRTLDYGVIHNQHFLHPPKSD